MKTEGDISINGLVIVSCGVRANKDCPRGGIACERSVVVNKYMETNIPDIYACGDCAQFGGVNSALWSGRLKKERLPGKRGGRKTGICRI